MKLIAATLTAPLKFYRRFISPYTPASCRFSPTTPLQTTWSYCLTLPMTVASLRTRLPLCL